MLDCPQRDSIESVSDFSFDDLTRRTPRRNAHVVSVEVERQEDRGTSDTDMVPVGRIKPLDGGSRLLRNPKWIEIKESIRASGGLTDALAVTSRPGDQDFTCYSGGNTRLLALQELYRETGDPAFGSVRVDVQPFTSDFELVALHHRENACRGDCTFFEDAWATYRMYKAFCDSQDRDSRVKPADLHSVRTGRPGGWSCRAGSPAVQCRARELLYFSYSQARGYADGRSDLGALSVDAGVDPSGHHHSTVRLSLRRVYSSYGRQLQEIPLATAGRTAGLVIASCSHLYKHMQNDHSHDLTSHPMVVPSAGDRGVDGDGHPCHLAEEVPLNWVNRGI